MRNEVLRDICNLPSFPILSSSEQSMLQYMGIQISDKGHYYGGHSRLSVKLGMGIRTVNRTLSSLQRQGFIKRTRKGGGRVTAEYELFIPGRDYEGETTREIPVKSAISEMTNVSPKREDHCEQVDDGRGSTPDKPQGAVQEAAPAEVSQASVSRGEFEQPPSVPGKPHTFRVTFEPRYKFPDPKW